MTISDDFKEKLTSGKIPEALTLALSEAVELEITTWVSTADSDTDSSEPVNSPAPGYRMRTRMNIIDGDIENEVGSQFIGNGPYTELRQFHNQQVLAGRQIIQQNLQNLQQLFIVLNNTLAQMPGSSHRLTDGNPVLPPSSRDNLP
ncbi:MAG: hypothetical protein KME06_07610 [Kastovskya adunca ATA6-11-RM4]|nr:hypothetical protein [Kastovskya adunca ATA6-11-RM4]